MVTKRTEDTQEKYRDRNEDTGIYAVLSRDNQEAAKPHHVDEKVSLFWRVFGGTILSIAALVAITVFNTFNNSITELRGEVVRLNEAKAESAKKDDLSIVRNQVSVHESYRKEIDSLKERATKYRAEIEEAKKDTQIRLDAVKKERETDLDGIRKEYAAELKLAKEEISRVRQDVDKNQAADNERRDQRTAQMKVIDETLKEIQKALLETRERLARIEGQQAPTKTVVPAKATETVDAPR